MNTHENTTQQALQTQNNSKLECKQNYNYNLSNIKNWSATEAN